MWCFCSNMVFPISQHWAALSQSVKRSVFWRIYIHRWTEHIFRQLMLYLVYYIANTIAFTIIAKKNLVALCIGVYHVWYNFLTNIAWICLSVHYDILYWPKVWKSWENACLFLNILGTVLCDLLFDFKVVEKVTVPHAVDFWQIFHDMIEKKAV